MNGYVHIMCITRVFVFLQADKRSVEELLCADMSSPRTVIYVAEGHIASVFVVADKEVRIKIPTPTIQKTLACLLATYSVWHLQFPTAYANTLTFMRQDLFHCEDHRQASVHKFVRQLLNSTC